jgi:hypothetical protein
MLITKANCWKNDPNFVKEVPMIYPNVFIMVILVPEKNNEVLISSPPPIFQEGSPAPTLSTT